MNATRRHVAIHAGALPCRDHWHAVLLLVDVMTEVDPVAYTTEKAAAARASEWLGVVIDQARAAGTTVIDPSLQ